MKEKERGKEAIFQEKKAANLLECSHSDQRTAVHAHSQWLISLNVARRPHLSIPQESAMSAQCQPGKQSQQQSLCRVPGAVSRSCTQRSKMFAPFWGRKPVKSLHFYCQPMVEGGTLPESCKHELCLCRWWLKQTTNSVIVKRGRVGLESCQEGKHGPAEQRSQANK